MGCLDEAMSVTALRAALDRAVSNGGGPGADGVTLRAFSARAAEELANLRETLLDGSWSPLPVRRVYLPKPGGGHRSLAIGAVRDRVVQHALAATLSAHFDGALHGCAYAWRRGRSARDALDAVEHAMAGGHEWIYRGDIEDFFDTIPRGPLLAALSLLVEEPALVELVGRMLDAGAMVGGDILDPARGTGQGSPLSPFLANVYLLPLDRAVEAAGFPMARYGDDLCVLAYSRSEVERARAAVRTALGQLRLKLNANKEMIRHQGEGFVFLGYQIDPRGRHAGPKARRSLVKQVEELLKERPTDHAEELQAVLRGWIEYYGSLEGVDLPEEVRALAERLVEARGEARALSSRSAAESTLEAPAEPPGSAPKGPPEPLPPPSFEGVRKTSTNWASVLWALSLGAGSPSAEAARAGLGESLGLSPSEWSEVCEALLRGDHLGAAERLAHLGRFGDAEALRATPSLQQRASESSARASSAPLPAPASAQAEASAHATSPTKVQEPPPATPAELTDAPRWSPRPQDAERLLELFGGCEGAYLCDARVGVRVERRRILRPPTVEVVREHLGGRLWLGAFPLRTNHTVRFAAVRLVVWAEHRQGPYGASPVHLETLKGAALATFRALEALGLRGTVSQEPGRALVLWVLFAEPLSAKTARALMDAVARRAGPVPEGLTRELYPQQDTATPTRPGSAILLPLGLDAHLQRRAWFCDEGMEPVPDPCAWLRSLAPNSTNAVNAALTGAATLPPAPTPGAQAPTAPSGGGTETGLGAPLREHPRSLAIYEGCNVLRHFVDQAVAGKGLSNAERYAVAEMLGRVGDEAVPALDAVYRYLQDYRPGMGARFADKLYTHPTSCYRFRERMPELTARVGCDCRFRVPPGAYPTPVLHALGAAEVPVLAERIQAQAAKGGLARAALAAMNEGRKEMGARAVALSQKIADLRRQGKLLEKKLAETERELDGLLDEAGDEALETPSGTLRREIVNGVRKFIIEV